MPSLSFKMTAMHARNSCSGRVTGNTEVMLGASNLLVDLQDRLVLPIPSSLSLRRLVVSASFGYQSAPALRAVEVLKHRNIIARTRGSYRWHKTRPL